jgi:hypothetical protein
MSNDTIMIGNAPLTRCTGQRCQGYGAHAPGLSSGCFETEATESARRSNCGHPVACTTGKGGRCLWCRDLGEIASLRLRVEIAEGEVSRVTTILDGGYKPGTLGSPADRVLKLREGLREVLDATYDEGGGIPTWRLKLLRNLLVGGEA